MQGALESSLVRITKSTISEAWLLERETKSWPRVKKSSPTHILRYSTCLGCAERTWCATLEIKSKDRVVRYEPTILKSTTFHGTNWNVTPYDSNISWNGGRHCKSTRENTEISTTHKGNRDWTTQDKTKKKLTLTTLPFFRTHRIVVPCISRPCSRVRGMKIWSGQGTVQYYRYSSTLFIFSKSVIPGTSYPGSTSIFGSRYFGCGTTLGHSALQDSQKRVN